ncbi:MAG: hypothetical protein IKX45_01685 [Bacteroidales bacterium]|nr:hypothetical protein [Bacteroidales bacterium]
MFMVIYIAVILFALYVILHDCGEGEGKSQRAQQRMDYRPEQPGPVPQTPVSPAPKPLEPAPAIKPAEPARPSRNVAERSLSWSYLDKLDYDRNLDCDTFETEITGMRYYCSLADLGLVNGIVKPEPENPHDRRAHVVLRADGKKLGYLPSIALNDYADFNKDDLVCPFSGRVRITHQGYIWADILIALPQSRDFVAGELTEYIKPDK